MNERKLFKIDNETQADFIRIVKSMYEAGKRWGMGIPPSLLTHIKLPDGTNHKLKDLFQALEEYDKFLNIKITLNRMDIWG